MRQRKEHHLRAAFRDGMAYAKCVNELDGIETTVMMRRGGGLPTAIVSVGRYTLPVERLKARGVRYRVLARFNPNK